MSSDSLDKQHLERSAWKKSQFKKAGQIDQSWENLIIARKLKRARCTNNNLQQHETGRDQSF